MKLPAYNALAIVLATLLGTGALWWGSSGFSAFTAEAARRQEILLAPRPMPSVTLEDQDGHAFHLQDYKGRLLAVEFIYTSCNSICYGLGNTFRQIRERIAPHPAASDFALLSISFDPQRDDPTRLREYGRNFGADGRRWRLARVKNESELAALLKAFGIVAIADGRGGFEHNAAIHLVGRNGLLKEIHDLDAISPFVDTVTAQL